VPAYVIVERVIQNECKQQRQLDFETPRLSVIASFKDDGTFAERLDRAIERSGQTLVIEHQPRPRPIATCGGLILGGIGEGGFGPRGIVHQ
jgi:hypothetical protein